MQQRLAGLSLLERATKTLSDAELAALIEQLTEEQQKAVTTRCGSLDATAVRNQMAKGRLNGLLEGLATVLADKSLADCIESLGESSDDPSYDELQAVLPGLIERHGVGAVRVMLATAIVGEAKATPILKDLLKNDEAVALPPAEAITFTVAKTVDPDREAKLAVRKARKDAEKAEKAKKK